MSTKFTMPHRPIYFLSSLGMGGLSVSFFMYLMFLVPHPGTPIPHFDHLAKAYATGTLVTNSLLTLVLAAIAWFAFRHIQLLVANLKAYGAFTKSPEFAGFRNSNAEVQVMAVPLTLAMTMNVMLIVGALAIPGMWSVKEYLFPVVLLAMTGIAGYGVALFMRYLGRILSEENFDIDDTNHFSQVLPSFAFAMIATGYSSSAAMSSTPLTAIIGMLGTFVFLTASFAWAVVKLPVSFSSMLRRGMAVEAGPTLWLGIPVLTLVGITVIRDTMGMAHTLLHVEVPSIVWFVFFGLVWSAQVVLGAFGYTVMKRQGYFRDFVVGDKKSIPSYGLICPGVAFTVLTMFFIHWGLVAPGFVEKYSLVHYALLIVPLATQVVTIWTVRRLNAKLYGTPAAPVAPAAGARELAEANA